MAVGKDNTYKIYKFGTPAYCRCKLADFLALYHSTVQSGKSSFHSSFRALMMACSTGQVGHEQEQLEGILFFHLTYPMIEKEPKLIVWEMTCSPYRSRHMGPVFAPVAPKEITQLDVHIARCPQRK